MKPLLALFAIGLLSVGATACGGASKGTGGADHASSNAAVTDAGTATSTSTATPSLDFRKADGDKDNDIGAPGDDRNNNSVLDFAHAAGPSDRQAIAALIKRYYAAALAEDGAKACSMLYSTLAEAVPEDYGTPSGGQPYMQGTTCPAVMTLLFKHFHDRLTVELPKLEVTRVRLEEHHGLAVLAFGTMPEREIQVAREGHAWKIEALLDSELP
jgi:hypothetical protein